MQVTTRHRICLAVVLAVLRDAIAGQQVHTVRDRFGTSLRTQAVPALSAHLLEDEAAAASPTEGRDPKTADNEQMPQFKMPRYNSADSLGALTNGFLDWFVVIYWGTILAFLLLVELVTHSRDGIPITHSVSQPSILRDSKSSGSIRLDDEEPGEKSVGWVSEKSVGSILLDDDVLGRSKDLAPNVWALNLVASHGNALDRNGNALSARVVYIAAIGMGLLQLLTLFLVVYDIDPAASPYTHKPGVPWKTSPLTVNTMKVVMVFFLGMYVVSEAADAYDNYLLGLALKAESLLVHRFFVLSIPVLHYFITLCVILAGVSVVLSCQDVSNILYNSMAILFITRVDELFWGFFERTFDICADWRVLLHESQIEEIQLFKKCIIMFPMLLGFCLLGRAWYREQMPALVVRVLAGST